MTPFRFFPTWADYENWLEFVRDAYMWDLSPQAAEFVAHWTCLSAHDRYRR